jgi:hypothetical protein
MKPGNYWYEPISPEYVRRYGKRVVVSVDQFLPLLTKVSFPDGECFFLGSRQWSKLIPYPADLYDELLEGII